MKTLKTATALVLFAALDAPVQIEEGHELIFPSDVARSGYTLVEWGGSEV